MIRKQLLCLWNPYFTIFHKRSNVRKKQNAPIDYIYLTRISPIFRAFRIIGKKYFRKNIKIA